MSKNVPASLFFELSFLHKSFQLLAREFIFCNTALGEAVSGCPAHPQRGSNSGTETHIPESQHKLVTSTDAHFSFSVHRP